MSVKRSSFSSGRESTDEMEIYSVQWKYPRYFCLRLRLVINSMLTEKYNLLPVITSTFKPSFSMSISMSEPRSHTSESNASFLCFFLNNHIGVSGIKYKNMTRRAGGTPPIRASNFQWQKTPAIKDITRPVTMASVLIEPSMPRVRGCAISAMYTFRTTEIHS